MGNEDYWSGVGKPNKISIGSSLLDLEQIMRSFLIVTVLGFFVSSFTPVQAAPASYALTESGSKLYVQVFKKRGGAASRLAHDHVVLATGWTGSVSWDPENAAACSVSFSLPVTGLAPDSDPMRAHVGYESRLSASNQKKVRGNIVSLTQLAAEHFPKVTFQSTSCSGSGSTITVTGNLTIRGVSKTIAVPMEISADGGSFKAKGTFSATHEDFKFSPYTAMGGALRNETEMRFTVDVVGAAQ
jgi:polyisoprenoid-binding protein YceI